ncbi:MAG: FAD-dependent monooxygenase, partial [Persicimonas sp.]
GTVVVGADGIWSRVRASLWGDEPARYAGEYCFRGLALGEDADIHHLRELHGRGERFGIGALDQKLTYWWATFVTEEGFELSEADYKSFVADRFAGWPCNIPGLIEATKPADIHLDGLYDRPPLQSWSRGRVTLLGDAAHPTTPNLGQGGCMAIEDAAVLAELLATADTLDAALTRYEQLRIPRTTKLVREARRFGEIGQWRNPVAVWLREKMIAWTPQRIMRNQLLDKVAYDALALVRG